MRFISRALKGQASAGISAMLSDNVPPNLPVQAGYEISCNVPGSAAIHRRVAGAPPMFGKSVGGENLASLGPALSEVAAYVGLLHQHHGGSPLIA